MTIAFRRILRESQYLDPNKDFELVRINFEIRFDPLTNRTGRITSSGTPGPDPPDLDTVLKRSLEIGCPFCKADEPKSWGYYASGARRLYLCEECHRYLKTLDLRSGRRKRSPDVERALTVDMDLAAREKGYR